MEDSKTKARHGAGAFRRAAGYPHRMPFARADARVCVNRPDPTMWVDEWPVPGLTASARTRIKAQLLKAHAVYLRTPIDPYGFTEPVQQAFNGIASILFESDLLTVELLENQLPLFAIEAGIAGDWIHNVRDEPRVEIFAGYLGHPTVWAEWMPRGFLAAEIAEWHSTLLDTSAGAEAKSQVAQRFSPMDENYQVVEFDGRPYNLTPYESTIIRVLHKAHLERRGSLGIAEICKALGVPSGKMSDWFRGNNKPLKRLILHTGRQHYRLDL